MKNNNSDIGGMHRAKSYMNSSKKIIISEKEEAM